MTEIMRGNAGIAISQTIMANFIRSDKTMFCFTILRVPFAIFLPLGKSDSLSETRTISLASIAESEPTLPIETAQSALVITGASFIPSPAYKSLPRALSFSASVSFSSGRSEALYSSSPTAFATVSARSGLSPVSITVCVIPLFLRS